jgi:hypothetical protein
MGPRTVCHQSIYENVATAAFGLAMGISATLAATTAHAIDNSSIGKPEFREHKATYGLVYRLPKEVTEVLDTRINGQLNDRLLTLGLEAEARTFNLPHVSVVHVHSADPATPRKMLDALPKVPPVLNVVLKDFYTTEASKGAGHPWWLDLGIVKSGKSFEDMMAFNTLATAALTQLRDGPLPRCTGPVYSNMSELAKELTRTVGVSGVNIIKDGKEIRTHNPHNSLVYSMAKFDAKLQAAMKQIADDFGRTLPDGIKASFKDVSIVEIGFSGNVLRELYRISLEDGSAFDVATGTLIRVVGR